MVAVSETFDEFRASFSYGSRTDLNWKFLAKLSDSRAAEIVAEAMALMGRLGDRGDVDELTARLARWQAEAYSAEPVPERLHFDDAPFVVPPVPVGEATVTLMTSSGHFVDDPRPFGVNGMTQEEAIRRIGEFLREAPTLSEIGRTDSVQVRHGGYDIAGAVEDRNVALPVDRLVEFESDGLIGRLNEPILSFVGAASQVRMERDVAPEWADRIAGDGETDLVLLVPV